MLPFDFGPRTRQPRTFAGDSENGCVGADVGLGLVADGEPVPRPPVVGVVVGAAVGVATGVGAIDGVAGTGAAAVAVAQTIGSALGAGAAAGVPSQGGVKWPGEPATGVGSAHGRARRGRTTIPSTSPAEIPDAVTCVRRVSGGPTTLVSTRGASAGDATTAIAIETKAAPSDSAL